MKKNNHTDCSLHRRRIGKLELIFKVAIVLLKILEILILLRDL